MAKINIRDRNKGTGKKPNWEYRFEAAKIDGKRQHISKSGFRTKKEAQEAGAKAMAEYNYIGEVFTPSEESFADLASRWLSHVECSFKYSTFSTYSSYVNVHLIPKLGRYKVKSIKPDTVEKLFNELKNSSKKYSATVLKQVSHIIRDILEYAVYPLGWIKSNPASHIKMTLPQDRLESQRECLTKDEFDIVMKDELVIKRYSVVMMIAWMTGMRIGEICGLTWDCIDLENRIITVEKQLIAPERKIENEFCVDFLSSLKTRTSKRKIAFGETLCEALRKEKDRQERAKYFYGELYKVYILRERVAKNGEIRGYLEYKLLKDVLPGEQIVDFVCKDTDGAYISRPALHFLRKRLKKRYDIDFGYHKMRHSHATMLYDAGVNPKEIQARLGHATIATTMDIYTHNSEGGARQTADMFEEIIQKNGGQKVDKNEF